MTKNNIKGDCLNGVLLCLNTNLPHIICYVYKINFETIFDSYKVLFQSNHMHNFQKYLIKKSIISKSSLRRSFWEDRVKLFQRVGTCVK